MQATKTIKNHVGYFVAASIISLTALMIDVNPHQPSINDQASHLVMNYLNEDLQNW